MWWSPRQSWNRSCYANNCVWNQIKKSSNHNEKGLEQSKTKKKKKGKKNGCRKANEIIKWKMIWKSIPFPRHCLFSFSPKMLITIGSSTTPEQYLSRIKYTSGKHTSSLLPKFTSLQVLEALKLRSILFPLFNSYFSSHVIQISDSHFNKPQ